MVKMTIDPNSALFKAILAMDGYNTRSGKKSNMFVDLDGAGTVHDWVHVATL